MAKPANSERIYSDKLPMALKPVGCSYTGAEWKQYIRLFRTPVQNDNFPKLLSEAPEGRRQSAAGSGSVMW